MLTKTILNEYTIEKPYLKLTTNNKSQIYHLYEKDGVLCAQYVVLREGKPNGLTEKERQKQLQNAIEKQPLRAFIEPNNKTLGILVYRGSELQLPKHTEKYEYMSPKECFDYLLLKSIGL